MVITYFSKFSMQVVVVSWQSRRNGGLIAVKVWSRGGAVVVSSLVLVILSHGGLVVEVISLDLPSLYWYFIDWYFINLFIYNNNNKILIVVSPILIF